jgi:hypothetical protein
MYVWRLLRLDGEAHSTEPMDSFFISSFKQFNLALNLFNLQYRLRKILSGNGLADEGNSLRKKRVIIIIISYLPTTPSVSPCGCAAAIPWQI